MPEMNSHLSLCREEPLDYRVFPPVLYEVLYEYRAILSFVALSRKQVLL